VLLGDCCLNGEQVPLATGGYVSGTPATSHMGEFGMAIIVVIVLGAMLVAGVLRFLDRFNSHSPIVVGRVPTSLEPGVSYRSSALV
jgi:tetrahydromethanopterin S-methyltransferase subunit E